jgi:exodeoxyribonuclease-5
MELTREQKDVVIGVKKAIKSGNKQHVVMAGVAGSGKTLLTTIISKLFDNYASIAFTGKAANVIRSYGNENAQTIHSCIYRAKVDRDIDGNEIVEWSLKDPMEIDCRGFIVDEASMVSEECHSDLLSFGLPIIYVGDHAQLEPINSNFNLMSNPDFKLEKIHRNAGEIQHFAEHIRNRNTPKTFKPEKLVQIVKNYSIQDQHLAKTEQVICAFNKTRNQINNRVRRHLNIDLTYIAQNEKIVCLKNNRQLGLFNGMQGYVTNIYEKKGKNYLSFYSDGMNYHEIEYDPDQFGQEKSTKDYANYTTSKLNLFDYAYAITCHKAQGSEFDYGIVYEQHCDAWDFYRWAYTAASRFKKGLIWGI